MESFNMQPDMLRLNNMKVLMLQRMSNKELLELALQEKSFYSITTVEVDNELSKRDLTLKYYELYKKSTATMTNLDYLLNSIIISSILIISALVFVYWCCEDVIDSASYLLFFVQVVLTAIFYVLAKYFNIDKWFNRKKQ